MRKIKPIVHIIIIVSIISLLLVFNTVSPAHAQISWMVADNQVVCGEAYNNGDLTVIPLYVSTNGSAQACAVVKVAIKLKFNVKIGQGFQSKNSIKIETFSPPTDQNGETLITLPTIQESLAIGQQPKTKIDVLLKPKCSKIVPTDVYILEDCTNKAPIGCCSTSLTIPTTPSKTYSFCYSIYDIPGQNLQDNCSALIDNLNLFSSLLIDSGVEGFEFFAEWNNQLGCNYMDGECSVPTAITLASFEANPGNGKITLQWTTGDESDNLGFNIYRAETEQGDYSKINDTLIYSQAPDKQSDSYSYEDSNLKNGKTYYYQLEDVDIYGVKTMHGPVSGIPRLLYGYYNQ
jgi:hypothetical protein